MKAEVLQTEFVSYTVNQAPEDLTRKIRLINSEYIKCRILQVSSKVLARNSDSSIPRDMSRHDTY